tara:strand:- start:1500 stop:1826 length:327 start_codon:yes stop_codon:yes gene_type:complete
VDILCPSCQKALIPRDYVNHILPLKRFDVPEIQCDDCDSVIIPTLKSRSLWFVIFLCVLVIFMAFGKQLAELTPYGADISFIVLVIVYFFANGVFSYIWPRVIALQVK